MKISTLSEKRDTTVIGMVLFQKELICPLLVLICTFKYVPFSSCTLGCNPIDSFEPFSEILNDEKNVFWVEISLD